LKKENPDKPPKPRKISKKEVAVPIQDEETTTIEILADNNTETETNQMEIHTHGHIHETKKWKEYVFQFIMLFLAITLSFFVENQREHYIEHQRAKVLAASMVENLKSDLEESKTVIAISDSIMDGNTVLINELNKPRALQNDSIIHRNGLQKTLRFNVFDANSGNYDQVKFSGALRYFKPEIVNQLTSYETNKNYVFKMSKMYLDFYTIDLEPFCLKNWNPRFIDATLNDKPAPNPVFIKQPTQEFLDQIYVYAQYVNRLINSRLRSLPCMLREQKSLLRSLARLMK
jgi:hypothetical protein